MEEFSYGNSVIHKLDVRIRIAAALLFSVVTAVSHSIETVAMAPIFPIILLIIARVGVRLVVSRLAVVNGFLVFLWLSVPLTYPGEVVYSLGPLEVTRQGLLYCLLITIKSNAIVLTLIALLGTAPVLDLVHGLSHLGVPDKLVHLFFLCFRYIHVINLEYRTLLNAMKIRGFRPGTNLHTYKSYGYLAAMILMRGFDPSVRILAAMKCRGFRGKFYILHDYNMGKNDFIFAGAGTFFSIMLVVMG
jgi:cobalt/nickel transport system permease protein